MGDVELKRMHAIIGSMTRQERLHPAIIKGSRKRRIAAGSGNQVQDVNRLLKQFLWRQLLTRLYDLQERAEQEIERRRQRLAIKLRRGWADDESERIAELEAERTRFRRLQLRMERI